MKKFLSLILAVSVLSVSFASVGSAATKEDYGDGLYVIEGTTPTVADREAQVPVLDVTVTQLTTAAQVTAVAANAIWQTKTAPLSANDIYRIDVTVSNLGEVFNGYDSNFDPIRDGVTSVGITFPSTDFASESTKASQFAGGSVSCGTDAGTGDFAINWAASASENPYPIFDSEGTDSQYVANGTMSFAVAVALTKGATLDVSNIETLVNYINTDGVVTPNTNAVKKSASFGVPATVDVTSVTISGATAATVGDNVQLSATVAPDNATDKAVTWTKVSGDGAVSASGVVTANSAGDVVVKATAGGVDSANYTVSFAAPAPTPVYTDSEINVKKPVSGTTGLTDLQGKDVTLTANYGIAKFSKAIDTAANDYFVVATDSNDEEKVFDVDFGAKGVEISNASTTFFAIVKSADHIIKNIRLKEVAK